MKGTLLSVGAGVEPDVAVVRQRVLFPDVTVPADEVDAGVIRDVAHRHYGGSFVSRGCRKAGQIGLTVHTVKERLLSMCTH